MPLDSVFITALTAELSSALTGAKIEKVQQPGRSDLVLTLRTDSGRKNLFVGGAGGSARVHLSAMDYEKPMEPPMFCMLLRKHLIGARITAVRQLPDERIMSFDLDAPGMFGEGEKRGLVFELFGRTANVILTDGEGLITDCLYRQGSLEDKRAVLPGMRYRPPEKQDKRALTSLSDGEICDIVTSADSEAYADKWLVKSFFGLSPLVARELCWRACGDTSRPMLRMPLDKLSSELCNLRDRIAGGRFEPTLITGPDGTPFDFSYMPILQYGPEYALMRAESFSALLEGFWGRRSEEERRRQRSATLMKTVKGIRDRTERRIAAQRQELLSAENRETLRENGDLITSNLHTMKKGMTVLRAYDYYSPDGGEREIKLDPLKTPQQNAAKYYRDYTKLKRAEAHLTELILKGEDELEYLESVCDALSRAETVRDVSEIREELVSAGFIRAQSASKREKRRPEGPMRFVTDTGLEVRVGRNNTQNDALTLKQAARGDMWLHTQKIHGSHVVISCAGTPPDEVSLMQAASLAAYYSQARDGTKVPVDYTLIKYVKKPNGARPGMVIYTDYKTIYADPDEQLALRLRTK